MNRSPPAAAATPVSTKDPVDMASPARFSANVHETLPGPQATKDPKVVTVMKSVTAPSVNGDDTDNSPRVDLPSKTTAGSEVLNKNKPTLLSHQQLIRFALHPSAQRPACNKIEPEVETAFCSPDNKKTPSLQVKVTSSPDRKRTFADAGTQEEQEQFKREKTASPSRSGVGHCSIPSRANYRSKMKKYRALQRSENLTTSTTEEVASRGSLTVSQELSATNPVTVSSPLKSKSPLDVSTMTSPKTSPKISPKTSPKMSPKTSPKPSPGRKTGARKSGITPCRSDGAKKRKNDQICPAHQGEIPGQVDEKKEHVESSQKPRAERTSDMEKKTPKQNSQSPSSPGAEQSCCSKCEHKHSEKRTVKRRWLPLPSNVTSLRLYGPVFCRLHKQKAKRDAAKTAKYQPKLATIPEGPDEIDPEYDGNKIAEWLREEMKKISRCSSSSLHSQYNWPN